MDVIADHGAFNATAQPTKYPAGFFHVFTGSYDFAAAHCNVTRRLHEQGARRRGVRLLVPRDRGRVPGRAHGRRASPHELGIDPAELRMKNFIRPEQFPYRPRPAGRTTPATTSGAMRKALDIAGYDDLRREQAEKRARGELMGIGVVVLHRGRRRRAAQAHGHRRPGHGRRRRPAHPPDRQGGARHLSVQSQGQGHETTFAQIVAEELGIPPEDIDVVHGDTDQHAVRPRHVRLALDAGVGRRDRASSRARSATRRGSSRRRCSRRRRTTWSGRRAAGS